jgi:hypothetical protein
VLQKKVTSLVMTPIAEALKKEHPNKKHYWENELKSLGKEPRRQNELNDKEEEGFRHWQKALRQFITKITKRHIVI